MSESSPIRTDPGSDEWFDEYFWSEWDKLNEDTMDEAWDSERKSWA